MTPSVWRTDVERKWLGRQPRRVEKRRDREVVRQVSDGRDEGDTRAAVGIPFRLVGNVEVDVARGRSQVGWHNRAGHAQRVVQRGNDYYVAEATLAHD